jgi:hypothetical protein
MGCFGGPGLRKERMVAEHVPVEKQTIQVVAFKVNVDDSEGKDKSVPMASSFRFFACECHPPCGLINVIFEGEDGEPFAVAQFSYDQLLGPLTEVALAAREACEGKIH